MDLRREARLHLSISHRRSRIVALKQPPIESAVLNSVANTLAAWGKIVYCYCCFGARRRRLVRRLGRRAVALQRFCCGIVKDVETIPFARRAEDHLSSAAAALRVCSTSANHAHLALIFAHASAQVVKAEIEALRAYEEIGAVTSARSLVPSKCNICVGIVVFGRQRPFIDYKTCSRQIGRKAKQKLFVCASRTSDAWVLSLHLNERVRERNIQEPEEEWHPSPKTFQVGAVVPKQLVSDIAAPDFMIVSNLAPNLLLTYC